MAGRTKGWVGVGCTLIMMMATGRVVSGDAGANPQHVYINDPAARRALALGLEGAVTRLIRPDCRQVLSDFANWPGRRIVADLEATGVSLREYMLTRIWFVDGSDARECLTATSTAAFTGVGDKVVRVCPARVADLARDMAAVEVLVIHEVLHTLGLPENPPSSADITRKVRLRCGRSRRHHHRAARTRAAAGVAVRHRGIEIDRVAGRERVRVLADLDHERAGEDVHELDARVRVQAHAAR